MSDSAALLLITMMIGGMVVDLEILPKGNEEGDVKLEVEEDVEGEIVREEVIAEVIATVALNSIPWIPMHFLPFSLKGFASSLFHIDASLSYTQCWCEFVSARED
mmetsp:Transcript_13993/g.21351  ORF Transcript_13993/g.21351 Transcript_13993/m.21351 type:complete len:105 (+) Transcript_13993:695-1009(+)